MKMRYGLAVGIVMLLSSALAAQFPGGGMQMPRVQGVWAPVVGAGSTYQMESKGKKETFEYAVVGKEMHEGKEGYWVEMTVVDRGKQTVVKHLYVKSGANVDVARMIVQEGNEQPMEIPLRMMQMGGPRQQPQKADIRDGATRVGAETITVPAGTFVCEHWKNSEGDYWVSEKVAPLGLVKAVTGDTSMTLTKVVSDAKTKIRGVPQKIEMPY
ncbi:MAG TPA: hypothetical protein VNL38_03875 [Candidatus Nitrosotenuis sp.]|nr:hypothetical protein [Candidatus Nitrosotenuis sp.]